MISSKRSKFHRPLTFKEMLTSLKYSILFWKGRSKGMIHTRNLKWDDLRYIFFPSGFDEKYGYLGTGIWDEKSDYFKALFPLILALDYEAKPRLCPRWFLRFLHIFGSDKSIVRVRNRRLHNLLRKLTKGIAFIDWKTKWKDYDLRISIHSSIHLQNLADDIEHGFYSRGAQKELAAKIKDIDPNASIIWGSVEQLEKLLEKTANKMNKDEQKQAIIEIMDADEKDGLYDIMGNNKKPHGFCETPEEKCTMNYCDDNGCINRKRTLVGDPVDISNNKQSSVRELCDSFYEENIDQSNIPREHWDWEIKQLMIDFAIHYNETSGGNNEQ